MKMQPDKLIKNIATNYRKYVLGSILPNIIHEINSPLTALDINLKTLSVILQRLLQSTGFFCEEENRSILNDMGESIGKIKKIVTDLRATAIKETNCAYEEININDVADKCISLLSCKHKYKVKVTRNFEENINKILSNRDNIEGIILNLILNSIESIDKLSCGELGISTLNIGSDTVEVVISDTGGGFGPAVFMAIKNKDYLKLPSSDGHLGLGIYISYILIDQIGGEIEFKNNLGFGAECRIKIPTMKF